ncbi:hypothetical protein BC628DRAFT_1311542 [Trametes gibbosa]|nr:hypothetical protein BC628DRAFT_1311542 [Trametes gibbosa]
MNSLTKFRVKHEDTGFLMAENAELTRSILAALRARKAHTAFEWVKGHNGHPRNEGADQCAGEGARKPPTEALDLSPPAALRLSGARLGMTTQKIAYRAIRNRKNTSCAQRPAAVTTLAVIAEDLAEVCDYQVTDRAIWLSLRKKDITREARQFLWKLVQDAFMVGRHWLRPSMPDLLKERATCTKCLEVESLDHILFRCEARGREKITSLLRKTWENTGVAFPGLRWGTAVGAGCVIFKSSNDARLTLTERLWTILATESLYLIWKLRCERVIQKDGRDFSNAEIESRWYATINRRLTLDRRSTAPFLEKRALDAKAVAATWSMIIENAENLPPNWVGDGGVLVGIRRGR